MSKRTLLLTLLAAAAAGAWASDMRVYGPPATGLTPGGDAGTRELRWDNGTRQYFVVWYTGEDHWVGNDFVAGTTRTAVQVLKLRVYTASDWPNERWDGMRAALYDFTPRGPSEAGLVGSMIWPTNGEGYAFKPSSVLPGGEGWVDVPVGWSLPPGYFLAAIEQRYNDPNCDPFAVDTNRNFRGHSYEYGSAQRWAFLAPSSDPYRNLMLRAVVDEGAGMEPASLGRVKALYF